MHDKAVRTWAIKFTGLPPASSYSDADLYEAVRLTVLANRNLKYNTALELLRQHCYEESYSDAGDIKASSS